MVLDPENSQKNQRMGDKGDESIPLQKQKNKTWADYHARARKLWLRMSLPFLYEVIAESMWRAMVWVCDERSTAVIDTLKNVLRWRSTEWWQSTQAKGMKEDPCNHTRWKHKWGVAQSRRRLGENGYGLGW